MIFLGAGASAPFGIPTSDTLTAEIRNMLSKEHKNLLNDITTFWNRHYEGKHPNYENILTALMGLTDPRKIARDSIVQAFVNDFKEHRGSYESIVDEMYSRIVAYCNAPFVSSDKYLTPEKLEEIFQQTYDLLTLLREDEVFTTNYDPSIEIWCQKRNIQIHDNTNATRNPEIKEVLPINEEIVASGRTNLYPSGSELFTLKVVRLHGSTWVYETKKGQRIKMNRPSDRLMFIDWYPHLNKKPHLIFPGQESVLASGEWDVLYQYFKKKLRGNCLVIGYSFQDNLINQVFFDNLKRGQLETIGIMAPHPNEGIKNLFWNQDIPHDRIVQMPVEFGTYQAIEEIYRWMNRVYHITFYASPAQVISQVRERMKSYLD